MDLTLFENHWYDSTFDPNRRAGATEAGDGESVPEEGEEETASDDDEGRSLRSTLAPVALVAGTAAGAVALRRFLARRAQRPRIEIDAVAYTNDLNE